MHARRHGYALAVAVVVLLLESQAVRPEQPPFPFSIAGGVFRLDGKPVFLNMISPAGQRERGR